MIVAYDPMAILWALAVFGLVICILPDDWFDD